MDTNYSFINFTASGDSCLGTHPTCSQGAVINPSPYWVTAGSGRSSGALQLNGPASSCTAPLKAEVPQSVGQVVFTSTAFFGRGSRTVSSGASIGLCLGDPYGIKPVNYTESFYAFWQWQGLNVKFLSPTSVSQNTINLMASNGVLYLETQNGTNTTTQTWGGLSYVGSDVTSAQGSFTMPGAILQTGSGTDEPIVYWIGIGGFIGNESLWQAGIEFDYSSNCNNGQGGTCANLFYEIYDPHGIGSCIAACYYPYDNPGSEFLYNFFPTYSGYHNNITIYMLVTSNSTSGGKGELGYFSISFNGKEVWGTSNNGGPGPIPFMPDKKGQSGVSAPNVNSAEWIAENPTQSASNPSPNVGNITWFNLYFADNGTVYDNLSLRILESWLGEGFNLLDWYVPPLILTKTYEFTIRTYPAP